MEEAAKAFERVFELKPNASLWQAGIPHYYLGDLGRASQIFAQSTQRFESLFGEFASEERIWRCACELKYLTVMNQNQSKDIRETGDLMKHIAPVYTRDPDSEPLEKERR